MRTILLLLLTRLLLLTSSPERRARPRELVLVPQLLPDYTTPPLPPASPRVGVLQARVQGGVQELPG